MSDDDSTLKPTRSVRRDPSDEGMVNALTTDARSARARRVLPPLLAFAAGLATVPYWVVGLLAYVVVVTVGTAVVPRGSKLVAGAIITLAFVGGMLLATAPATLELNDVRPEPVPTIGVV